MIQAGGDSNDKPILGNSVEKDRIWCTKQSGHFLHRRNESEEYTEKQNKRERRSKEDSEKERERKRKGEGERKSKKERVSEAHLYTHPLIHTSLQTHVVKLVENSK